jgi:hypothetical protein
VLVGYRSVLSTQEAKAKIAACNEGGIMSGEP